MINIRKATVSDAECIANINVATWKTAYKDLLPDDFLQQRNVTEKRIQSTANSINNGERIWLVAQKDNQVIAFCCGGKARDENFPAEYELCAIYVLQSNQNQGVGKALLDEFRKQIDNKPFYLYALKGNNKATKFYTKNGGTELPEYEKDLPIPNIQAKEILFYFDKK